MNKIKFVRNLATLGLETVAINPKEILGILDLRSIGY